MATEISSTKDGKIRFRIKALKTNLLGKLSLVKAEKTGINLGL